VDRTLLPTTPGRWSGTIRLSNVAGPLGTIRVVVYVQERQRAGSRFTLYAEDAATGAVEASAHVGPDTSYRYWLRHLPLVPYLLRAGEDIDADGVICEPTEACGYHGGPTEADAVPVTPVEGTATTGVNVSLYVSPPP
jgi:hypothetical protein